MYRNQYSIEMFEQMVAMGDYYASGRPVKVPSEVIIGDILNKVPIKRQDTLLDVGCGTGVVTLPLSRLCQQVYAVDAGARVIATAKENAACAGVTNINYQVGHALNLPFKDDFVDHTIMYAVIHYLENESQVDQCLKELIRVTKPGGTILIAEIPDQAARQEFDQRAKTPQEIALLDAFNAKRGEYDQLFKENVNKNFASNSLVLNCQTMANLAKSYGCDAQVCLQDIRQPFSLTRRDVVIKKKSKG